MPRRSHPRPRPAAALCLLAAGGLLLAPASAIAWESPTVLSPPTASVDGPYLAVNAHGDALLAWARGRPVTEEWGLPPSSWVEAALRPSGSGWSPAERLSPGDELALRPLPALPPSGAGAVWWTRIRRGVLDVTAGEATHAGGWAFRPLETETGVWTDRAAATGPDGTLAVAEVDPWQEKPELRVRVRTPDGTWRESAPVEASNPDQLEVALSPDGTVFVASLEQLGEWGSPAARTRIVSVSWNPATGAWGAPDHSAYMPGAGAGLRLAAAADGTMVVAIVVRRGQGFAVAVASRPPGATFEPPKVLSLRSDPEVEIAASPMGEVFVAWNAEDGPRLSVRRSGGGWSRPEGAPRGTCVRPQSVVAVAAGPSGEALLVAIAGYANDGNPGLVRAWVRRPDGSWAGPVWLSRAFAGHTVAAIDGTGRMHVAWNRQDRRYPVVEATSATPADAAVGAVRQDPVAVVSQLRVVSRGRARTVRFRLSRPGRVTLSVVPAARPESATDHETSVAGRRGANVVPIAVRGAKRLPPGRWAVRVEYNQDFIAGCPVTSAPFRIR